MEQEDIGAIDVYQKMLVAKKLKIIINELESSV